MMMDDSTTFQEEQIQKQGCGKIRERTFFDMSPPRSVNVEDELCSREKIVKPAGDVLDVEVFMEVDLIELNDFCIIPFKGSKGKQSIDLNDFRTSMMKFVIIGKTMTSNGKIFWEYLNVLCEYVENKFMDNEVDFAWDFIAVKKDTANNRQTYNEITALG